MGTGHDFRQVTLTVRLAVEDDGDSDLVVRHDHKVSLPADSFYMVDLGPLLDHYIEDMVYKLGNKAIAEKE